MDEMNSKLFRYTIQEGGNELFELNWVTHEEAELACINKLIEIITLQQKNETESSKS